MNYRTVILLSELKELQDQGIAEILGASLGVVKIRLHCARVELNGGYSSKELILDTEAIVQCDTQNCIEH